MKKILVSTIFLVTLFSRVIQANDVELWNYSQQGAPEFDSSYIYNTRDVAATEGCLDFGRRIGNTNLDHYEFWIDGNSVETNAFRCYFTNADGTGLDGYAWWSVGSTLDICGTTLHYDVTTGQCVTVLPEFYLGKQDIVTSLLPTAQQCDASMGAFSPSIYTKNPVNTANGNKYRKEIDYNQLGISPLSFARYYSSNKNQTTNIGKNWRHSYTASLTANISSTAIPYVAGDSNFSSLQSTAQLACESGWNDIKATYNKPELANSTASYINNVCSIQDVSGNSLGSIGVRDNSQGGIIPNPPQDTVVIERPNGNTLVFTSINSVWTAPSDTDVLLLQTATGYTLTTAQDTVEIYNLAGQLLSMTDRKGMQQTLTYNATTGLLETVTDSFGKSLSFAYTGSNLTSVTLPDGAQLTYSYDSNNNFSSVTREDNTVKTYVYEDARFPNALTGIIDEKNQRYMTFSYDAQGRAITSELAGGVERVVVNFIDAATSTVTDALGQLRTYRFTTVNGEKRLADLEGGACTSCGGGATHTTYDANGYVNSSTDFNGNVTTMLNNARGLVLTRTEAVGSKDERVTNYEWHPTYTLPTCIIESAKTTRLSYSPIGLLETRTSIDTSDVALFATPASKACAAIEARGDYVSLNKRSISYTYYPN